MDGDDPLLASYQDSLSLYSQFEESTQIDARFREKLNHAVEIIEAALHVYGENKISIAFNGGKDATVILHLYRAALAKYVRDNVEGSSLGKEGLQDSDLESARRARVVSMFIVQSGEFPEVKEFVERMYKDYAVDASYLHSKFMASVTEFLKDRPRIEAFVLGTRRDDPDGRDMEHFFPSSKGWPKFMRINPILNWDFADIWTFLRLFNLPYCCLYDRGYTSLGSMENTHRNPMLRNEDGTFCAAYQLSDKAMERAGRVADEVRQMMEQSTYHVGLLIISTELERGLADVSNSGTYTLFRMRGMRLRKLVIVPDDVEEVAKEVKSLADSLDIVVTAGGLGSVGNTAVNAVAKAFDIPLTKSAKLEELLKSSAVDGAKDHQDFVVTTETEIISCGGKEAESEARQKRPFPTLKTRNVYNLPAVESMFQSALERIINLM